MDDARGFECGSGFGRCGGQSLRAGCPDEAPLRERVWPVRREPDPPEREPEREPELDRLLLARVPPVRLALARVPPERVPPERVPPERVPPERLVPERLEPEREPPDPRVWPDVDPRDELAAPFLAPCTAPRAAATATSPAFSRPANPYTAPCRSSSLARGETAAAVAAAMAPASRSM